MKYLVVFVLMLSYAYGQKTIVYDQKNNLGFDIYYPKNYKENQTYNVFAWVHGGGFSGGSKTDPDEIKRMKDAQERGFVAISISYRLLANSSAGFGCDLPKQEKLKIFKEASFDVLKALDYVQNNQKSLKFNINKMILGGSSAGAETVLNAHYLRDLWFGNQFNQIKIDGLVSYAGAVVDERYVTPTNILPTVYVHGLSDDVVPSNNAPHRRCLSNQQGFFPLAGSQSLENLNRDFRQSSLSIFSKTGKHEWSGLKKEYLNNVFDFINNSIINDKKINNRIIVD